MLCATFMIISLIVTIYNNLDFQWLLPSSSGCSVQGTGTAPWQQEVVVDVAQLMVPLVAVHSVALASDVHSFLNKVLLVVWFFGKYLT